MALDDSGPAPYAPAKSIVQVIDHVRERGVSGGTIWLDTLKRIGIEESLVRRTLASLKQLDLIGDDGAVSPTLERIRVAPSTELQDVLGDWLKEAYKPIFQYIEPTDPVERITDQFRHYDPAGMRNRMVTLFLGLCAKAGLIEETPPMPRAKRTPKAGTGGTAPKPSTKKPKDTSTERRNERQDPGQTDGRQRYIDLLIAKAEAQDVPDQDLLDRIERALGIGATP